MDVNTLKRNYINQDKTVKIQEYLKQKEFIEKNNLQNVEIVDKVKSLGKDDFLKLLITQLSHQDPTKPMSDQEFIAQMAQFSSLEQMQNIAKSIEVMNQSQNFHYLGKYVIGKDSITGDDVAGVVDAIFKDETGTIYLKVKDHAISKDNITVIGLPENFIKKREDSYKDPANSTNHLESQTDIKNQVNTSRNNNRELNQTEIPKKNLEQEIQLKQYNQNILTK
ncbi:MAG: basal-body rod modification protein FlgD [Leptospiraceae bacterium]|nr:MAG: basal-body rod modification protein FlgD [Leptospiraceae bacterium]